MPETTTEPIRSARWGHPLTPIPPEIGQWLEMSYSAGQPVEIPAVPDSDDCAEFLRLARIYANRQKKAVDHQHVQVNGDWLLRFKMRDKRKYQLKTDKKDTPT